MTTAILEQSLDGLMYEGKLEIVLSLKRAKRNA